MVSLWRDNAGKWAETRWAETRSETNERRMDAFNSKRSGGKSRWFITLYGTGEFFEGMSTPRDSMAVTSIGKSLSSISGSPKITRNLQKSLKESLRLAQNGSIIPQNFKKSTQDPSNLRKSPKIPQNTPQTQPKIPQNRSKWLKNPSESRKIHPGSTKILKKLEKSNMDPPKLQES